jgi:hypothetical protein
MIELELAPHYEKLADPHAEDYIRIADALGDPPLYHQWRTYNEKTANIIVNSYNTGTGKTKAALLRLLDLDSAYRENRYITHIPQFAVAIFAISLVERIQRRELLDNAQ